MRDDEVKAGRELDRMVAEQVFGKRTEFVTKWVMKNGQPHHPEQVEVFEGLLEDLPNYSTSIQSAMTLLDAWHGDWKIRRQNDHYKVTLYHEPSAMQGNLWAETLPLAICRMRLRAAGWNQRPAVAGQAAAGEGE